MLRISMYTVFSFPFTHTSEINGFLDVHEDGYGALLRGWLDDVPLLNGHLVQGEQGCF